jgi:heavy metal translocating P-type ATPase
MEKSYQIKGMSCAACASKVEKAVGSIHGVSKASVNLMKNTCLVEFDDALVTDENVIAAVDAAGYEALISKQGNLFLDDESELKQIRTRLYISLVLTFFIMLLSMGHMFSLNLIHNAFFNGSLQGAMALIVAILQKQYFISALKALKHGGFNMDSLVSTGAAASFIYSVFSLLNIDLSATSEVLGSTHPVFFEGAAGILTFVAIGKYIENRAKHRTSSAVSALYDLAPKSVSVKRDGSVLQILLDSVAIGDTVVLKAGDKIGIDGIVISGSAHIDESALSGESRPVKKETGSEVKSATFVLDGYIEVEVLKVGEETTLSKIIKMVENTAQTKVPIARIADVAASYFVPAIFALSALTFIVWYFILSAQFSLSLTFAISVLVVSCPCALGLATPVAIMAGTGRAAREGIIFKSPEALEILGRADVIAFDKTGTLTTGSVSVVAKESLDENVPLNIAYLYAASIEGKSSHPIARAFYSPSASLIEVEDYCFEKGLGVSGTIGGKKYYVGNEKLLSKLGISLIADVVYQIESYVNGGSSVVYLTDETHAVAYFVLSDPLKEDSYNLISDFKKSQIKTMMLTGDAENTAEQIAAKLGISDYSSRLLPEDKLNIIKELQNQGKKVIMVGDGINDSASLSQADVGVGLKGSMDIALSSCDVILLKERLTDIYNAFLISRATMRNIRQNLFWAIIYNVLTIPVACGVFYPAFKITLPPMLCSILMGISSVCVVTNALRLTVLKIDSQKIQKESILMKKTICIEGMMCNHCTSSVKKSLEALPNVSDVEVSLEDKCATLNTSDESSDALLKAAVESAGFKVTDIK